MKLINTSLLIFLCLCSLTLMAQPPNKLVNDVVMPPPNAASLGTYSDIPVDLANGLPQVGVPIYTIQEGPLVHSIGLSYHSSGIRLGQPASWVGLGWTLRGGGMISRTVQGLPDEGFKGFRTEGFRTIQSTTTVAYTNYINDVQSGLMDAEPDIYTFNAGAISGKFFIDHLGEVQLIDKHTDVEIISDYSPISSSYESFTIVDPSGVRYVFGKSGTNVSYETMQAGTATSSYRSTWMLVKIESHDKFHSIDFSYKSEAYKYRTSASGYYEIGSNGANLVFPGKNGNIDAEHPFIWQIVQGKQLDKIEYSTGEVTFQALTNREDLSFSGANGPKRLDGITISTGQDFCQEFNLSYDYYQDANVTAPYGKRLRLKEVQEESCNNLLEKPPYVFGYVGNGALPHRLSKAVDHWGFYNGEMTNDNLAINIPSTSITHPIPLNNTTITYGSAKRESSESHMLEGVLEDITYPTGGSTHFDFEANKIDELQATSAVPLIDRLKSCLAPLVACCGEISNENTYSFTSEAQINFSVIDMSGNVQYAADNFTRYNYCETDFRRMRIEILNGASIVGSWDTIFTGQDFCTRNGISVPSIASSPLVSGVPYRFKVTSWNNNATFSLKENGFSVVDVPVGGLRLKRLTLIDNEGFSPSVIRDYKYKKFHAPSRSSGVLNRKPRYHLAGNWANGSGQTEFIARFYDSSRAPMTAYDGRHIMYREVTEDFVGVGENQYSYYNSPIDNTDIGTFYSFGGLNWNLTPDYDSNGATGDSTLVFSYGAMSMDYFIPNTTNISKIHGKLSKKRSLAEDGDEVLKELYFPAGYTTQVGQSVGIKVIGFGGNNIWQAYHYPLKVGARVAGTKESRIDGVESEEVPSYDPLWRFHRPVSTEIVNSNGEATIMNYTYPVDFAGQAAYDEMEARNILLPVVTEKVVANQLVDKSKIDFELFGGDNHPYPKYFYRDEITQNTSGNWVVTPDVLQGTINSYTAGKPSSFTKVGWDEETYQWTASGKIKQKNYKDLAWVYEYYPGTNVLSKITDVDGQFVTYEYDELMRFKESSARGGNVVSSVDYSYQGQDLSRPQNYQKSTTIFEPSEGSELVNLTTYQYFDGLGRGVQTIKKGYSNDGKDIATAMEYDAIGRLWRSFDPVEIPSQANDGKFVTINTVTFPDYTETEYYTDPLSRTFKVTPPSWNPSETSYGTNASIVTDPATGFNYPANSLVRQQVKDPDGRISQVFADKLGRTILTRQIDFDGTTVLTDTYTSYDLKGRVQKVYPPGTSSASPNSLYSYAYDGADNVITKKIPDQGATTYAYDDRDLPVAMSNASVPSLFGFVGSVYDDYGQLTKQGFVAGTASANFTIDPINELISNVYGTTGTSINKITEASVRVLDEDALSNDWITSINTYDPVNGRLIKSTENSYFNLTSGSEIMDFTYDEADNVTKTIYQHAKTGMDISLIAISETTIDHSGRSKANYHQLTIDGVQNPRIKTSETAYTVKDQMQSRKIGEGDSGFLQEVNYDYLANGFLSKINNPTNLGSDLFSLELSYDSPSTGTLQRNGNISSSVSRVKGGAYFSYDYGYDGLNRLTSANYRDALAGSNNDRYSTTYSYDSRGNIETLTRSGQYDDGNSPGFGQIDNLSYTYYPTVGGRSNRLMHVADNAPASSKEAGFNALVNNQYLYDYQGNLTRDPSKNTTIEYNYLNLPFVFRMPNDKDIENTYLANGTKVRETMKDNSTEVSRRDYVGPIQYLTVDGVSTIAFVSHADGRVVEEQVCDDLYVTGDITGTEVYEGTTIRSDAKILNGANIDYKGESEITLEDGFFVDQNATFTADNIPCTGTLTGKWTYQYNLTDHLGNNRVLFSDQNENGIVEASEILQQNHYYPFGMEMDGDWNQTAMVGQRYRYNGKEFSEELGLYDYGARWYDPAIARWGQIDPLADMYQSKSAYSYVENTPINAIDPDGNLVIFINGLAFGEDKGARSYWGEFAGRVENHFGENPSRSLFFHGGNNVLMYARSAKGRQMGRKYADQILDMIVDENGRVTETIKIITHSMGGVYGKSFVREILKAAKRRGVKGVPITLVADFDPFQANNMIAEDNIFTQQFLQDGNVFSEGDYPLIANQREKGANEFYDDEDEASHSIFTFMDSVRDLKEGTYKWNGEQWILQE